MGVGWGCYSGIEKCGSGGSFATYRNHLPVYALSSADFLQAVLAGSGIDFGQFEEPVGHRWGSNGGSGEARHHCGEIVAPVEPIFELGQITRHVLLVVSPVGSNNGGLSISQRCVDPSEGGRPCRGSARASFDDLMRTAGVGTCRGE
jgi:hypothetical protein